MYACMTSVGFDTSDKFENHWTRAICGGNKTYIFLLAPINAKSVEPQFHKCGVRFKKL